MAGRQAARRGRLDGPVTVTKTLGVGAGVAGSWPPLPAGALSDGTHTAGNHRADPGIKQFPDGRSHFQPAAKRVWPQPGRAIAHVLRSQVMPR